MTEQEALKYLKDANRNNQMVGILPKSDIGKCLIKALEENQKYRELERKLNGVDLTMLVNHWMEMEAEGEIQGYQRGRVLTNEDADKWDAYLSIGTPEEIKQKLSELERWHTTEVNLKIKNVFANTSTQICHNCDHKDEYIEELEAEMEAYRAIGTPEECRTAVEKQKEIKNNAVDDFVERAMKQFTDFDLKHGYPTVTDCKVILRDIAERLKGGGVDE